MARFALARDRPGRSAPAPRGGGDLARLSEALPDSVTGQPAHGFAYERLSDLLRYDRVQGLSVGLGYRVRAPGLRFTNLYGTVRYGLSDDRVTGRLSLVRDAPGGRLTMSGYRDIFDVDPFGSGRTIGNTLNALFVAHDNADYALAEGGAAGFETSLSTGLDLFLGARVERQTSVGREAEVRGQRLPRRRRPVPAECARGRGDVRRRIRACSGTRPASAGA